MVAEVDGEDGQQRDPCQQPPEISVCNGFVLTGLELVRVSEAVPLQPKK